MSLTAKKRILFSGGGTAGSVSPLLAIYDELRSDKKYPLEFEFYWVGTRGGIEREMVRAEGIFFRPIFSGKLRRYFSWKNFSDIFLIKLGFFQAFFFMLSRRPDLVLSAGGFVSVPVAWAAWILRVPIIIHQQDIRPGLANKLMAPFAKVITVSFEKSLKDYGPKAVWTGNPVRKYLTEPEKASPAANKFHFNPSGLPILLVVGGGTGAAFINRLIAQSKLELTKFCQIIHVTGKDKTPGSDPDILSPGNYQSFEFLLPAELAYAEKKAGLVITRAGMSFLTELSALAKPAIIIPIPDSHQEDNAKYFAEREAAVVLDQNSLNSQTLISAIKKILADKQSQGNLKKNISLAMKQGANENFAKIILTLIG